MTSVVRASAVVCTRNRGDRIVSTVRSLCSNDFSGLEIIVLDQSENEETARAMEEFALDERVVYVRSATVGIGWSRHLAVDLASAEHVLFTDDDCVVPPNWVAVMSRLLDDHPMVGMLFCNVVAADHDPSAGFIPAYVRTGDRIVTSAWQKCTARGIGAGMAVRKPMAQAIGSFDRSLGSKFPRTVGEEGDLALRLILAGHWVLETDQTAVEHDGFRTWEQGRDMAKRNFFGIGLVYAKPVRCGRLGALAVVLYEGGYVALVEPLLRAVRLQRPGFRNFWYFWKGFFTGLRHDVDKVTMNYVMSDHELEIRDRTAPTA
jgi:glycosyltransferase involved in cell wall biosynthesis